MFNEYPYINLQDLNLDYVFKKLSEMDEKLAEYVKQSTITFHDPITWDITDQYTINTMVIDSDGTAYLSVRPVPAGIDISNTEYWQPIFNYDDNINGLRATIAANERNNTTASAPRSIGDLVYLNGLVYKITAGLNIGDAYVIGSNCVLYTVSDRIRDLLQSIESNRNAIDEEVEARENADATIGTRIDDEINNRELADVTLSGRIDSEANARTAADDTLGTRIDGVGSQIAAETAARENADEELNRRITNLDQYARKYVVICDSYGNNKVSGRNFVETAFYNLGIDGYYNFNQGSAGFTQPGIYSFLSVLQNNEHVITNKNEITDIIVCGGANDQESDKLDQIYGAMSAFIAYCRTNYPKATVRIGHFTASVQPSLVANLYKSIYEYRRCSNAGATYVDNSEYIMTRLTNFQTDNVHPTNNGVNSLAKYLAAYIKSGRFDVVEMIDEVFESYGDYTVTNRAKQYQYNGIVTFKSESGGALFDISSVGVSVSIGEKHFVDIAKVKDTFVIPTAYNNLAFTGIFYSGIYNCKFSLYFRTIEANRTIRVGGFTYATTATTSPLVSVRIVTGDVTVNAIN